MIKMRISKVVVFVVACIMALASCKPQKGSEQYDSPSSGTINISVDESFNL